MVRLECYNTLSYPKRIYPIAILGYEYDTAVKKACKHKPTKKITCILACIISAFSAEFVFTAILRSLVKTRQCVRCNSVTYMTRSYHSASFTRLHFQEIEKQLKGSSTNEQETNTTSLHSLPEHTFVNLSFSVFLTRYATGERNKTEHMFALDTSISRDLPRDSWAARPGYLWKFFH